MSNTPFKVLSATFSDTTDANSIRFLSEAIRSRVTDSFLLILRLQSGGVSGPKALQILCQQWIDLNYLIAADTLNIAASFNRGYGSKQTYLEWQSLVTAGTWQYGGGTFEFFDPTNVDGTVGIDATKPLDVNVKSSVSLDTNITSSVLLNANIAQVAATNITTSLGLPINIKSVGPQTVLGGNVPISALNPVPIRVQQIGPGATPVNITATVPISGAVSTSFPSDPISVEINSLRQGLVLPVHEQNTINVNLESYGKTTVVPVVDRLPVDLQYMKGVPLGTLSGTPYIATNLLSIGQGAINGLTSGSTVFNTRLSALGTPAQQVTITNSVPVTQDQLLPVNVNIKSVRGTDLTPKTILGMDTVDRIQGLQPYTPVIPTAIGSFVKNSEGFELGWYPYTGLFSTDNIQHGIVVAPLNSKIGEEIAGDTSDLSLEEKSPETVAPSWVQTVKQRLGIF